MTTKFARDLQQGDQMYVGREFVTVDSVSMNRDGDVTVCFTFANGVSGVVVCAYSHRYVVEGAP